ncbi:4-hydroxy-tetrahydrodipicolinate reductase [Acuticoccus sp. M5D2P5]|uniref:4-hydroxy-tetrahydrodipicolinate reductase n=1 Tax=Acuticoccus kalidii TaxID=2910977 RepID=UPI001F34686A|nr:4-hydroxy-tetrahydrodipicolinate reductase [Acuticoccus kalidii]MCF3936427.1 4-hydroxy-tetrahydrodipicolinate reductase [Acuticoccus kalidii]
MKIGVVGAAGRMGRALIRAVDEDERTTLAAAVERPGAAEIGLDAGTLAGCGTLGVAVGDDIAGFEGCEAVLDFTVPAVSTALAARLAAMGVNHVIGTTGCSPEEDAAIAASAGSVVIVKSGNMSLGVNLLAALVRRAARALPQADLEVLEMHHRHKVDAPSGTALLLGEAAAEGRGVDLREKAVYAREGHTGPREAGTIGFATLRGGTVIGEHEVILALNSERVYLGHIAEERSVFANGAVAAALWTKGQAPGFYGMDDVLGLTGE